MKKLFAPLCVILILSCAYNPVQYFLKYQQNEISVPAKWQDEEIIVFEDSVSISVIKRGENNIARERRTIYYYVNNTKNEELKNLSFFQDSEIEELPSFEVSVLYPNSQYWKSDYYDFKIVPHTYNGEYLTDDKIHTIEIPDYTKGCIIRVSKRRDYVMPEFCSALYMRGIYPILNKHISLSIDTTNNWCYLLNNKENLKVDTSTTINENQKTFIVNAKDLSKIPDHDIPHPEDWFCALHVSIANSGTNSYNWKNLGEYYLSLVYRNQEQNSAALTNLIKKAHIDKNLPEDTIISKAFSYIQNNIRYYANMEDDHSFIPRSIPEILSKGYGDCKEMSVLLQGILYRLGVKTNLALVGTKGTAQYIKEIPTLSAFNHIIVYREKSNGEILYYDPTIDYGIASNSYMHLIGQKTLLLERGNSRPHTVGRNKDHKNLFTTKSRILWDEKNDSWIIKGTISFAGEAAYSIFPYMKKLDKEELSQFLKGFLHDFFDLEVSYAFIDSVSDDFCRIRHKGNFQKNYINLEEGGFKLSTPSLFGGNYRYTTQEIEGPRKFKEMQQIDEWILPSDYKALEETSLNTKFATGKWSKLTEGIRRDYKVKDIIISPDRIDERADYFKQKKNFLKAIIWH